MEKITLRYGDGTVSLDLSGAKSVRFLEGDRVPPITDLKSAFVHAITEGCVASPPLRELITRDDPVTIIISDITRFWMRQDRVCALLVDYLHNMIGVPYENMVVLVALGTHRPQTERELRMLATDEVYSAVRVVNHDCTADDLVCAGTTPLGTRVLVNPLVVGRKVIAIGGTVHHLMAGFAGGRKSILPGVSGKSTIEQNHIHSLAPDLPRSNPLIGMGALDRNPVSEDMNEAARLVKPAFGVNIVVNSRAEQCALACGDFEKAWEESCRAAQAMMGVPIEKKADMAVVSCGGYPKDINLYQAVKSLINAAQAVRDGGEIVFLAECREGGGASEYFDWIGPLRRGKLDEELRANFTIAGYIFYASCEVTASCRVRILTRIPRETVDGMGMRVCAGEGELLAGVDFAGKDVYVLPFGGNTVPCCMQPRA